MKHLRLWPRSLQGQLLLSIALALLLAQGISSVLLYRAQAERREAGLVHAAALRLAVAARAGDGELVLTGRHPPELLAAARRMRAQRLDTLPVRAGETRNASAEHELREALADQGLDLGDVAVVERPLSDDPKLRQRLFRRGKLSEHGDRGRPDHFMLAAIQTRPEGRWLAVRMPVPQPEPGTLATLVGQTLLLYALLVGVIAIVVGRITRPLAALTRRLEMFAATRTVDGQLEPQGPDDVRSLIVAHNAMEARIAALLDEKDVMLGAIGHDLKTPLAALRVRIESVEDEGERAKMARTIEDITRSLDDILSLARVGRASDPIEPTDLGALVAQVAEEYEDMGEPVTYAGSSRIVLPLRATWLRRALRNLVSNALRYGQEARIAVERTGDRVRITVEDDGPGIPQHDIARMLEPFTRGEPSRNTHTGGAGLGLTLARAIAEQHGGALVLSNRHGPDGAVAGLTATLDLPLRRA